MKITAPGATCTVSVRGAFHWSGDDAFVEVEGDGVDVTLEDVVAMPRPKWWELRKWWRAIRAWVALAPKERDPAGGALTIALPQDRGEGEQ